MKKDLTADRRNQLAKMLLSEGSLKVGEAAERFNVSTETIRKDIVFLDKEGIAKKSHGGAIVSSEMLEKPLSQKEIENANSKSKIALEALKLIPSQGVIVLDAGSTTLALAKLLALGKGLTIFTNSVLVTQVLANSENKLFSFGGMIRSSSLAIVGKWANEEISSINADISFIGTDGFKGLSGPATASYEEAEFKKNIVASSKKTVILSDSTKFSNSSLFEFCKWENVDALITDKFAPVEMISALRNSTNVIIA